VPPPFHIGLDNVSPGEATLPGGPGGMRTYLTSLATLLPAALPESRVTVFAPDWNASLGPLPAGVEVVPIANVPRSRNRRVIFQQWQFPRAVQSRSLDVFLATATVAPLRVRVPIVLAVQFLQFYAFPDTYGRLRTAYLRRLVPASIRRAARVIVFTEFQRRELLDHVDVDDTRIDVVPHGINHNVFARPASDAALAQARASAGGRPFILYVSATYRYKNHQGLIEAFGELKRRRKIPHVLLLAGTEIALSREDIAACAATAGVTGDVIFCGRLDDVAAAYQAAELFVFPSLYETFGFPVLEAMAAGCPVVASNRGATAELCGDAAELADPADPRALASAIERLLDDPPRRDALIARGRARAAAFTWERTAALTGAALVRAARR